MFHSAPCNKSQYVVLFDCVHETIKTYILPACTVESWFFEPPRGTEIVLKNRKVKKFKPGWISPNVFFVKRAKDCFAKLEGLKNQDCTVFLQKVVVMLTWLHSFRITTFEDFVKLVGKPYMWAQRIGGLDFLPEESHVRQTQCLYFRPCSIGINHLWLGGICLDLSLRVLSGFNWNGTGIIQPNQPKPVVQSD